MFSNDDRMVLADETSLWNAAEILNPNGEHAWTERINKLREQVVEVAREIRQYMDQFETTDEE